MKEQLIELRNDYITKYHHYTSLKRTFDDDPEALHRLQGKLSEIQLFIMELDAILRIETPIVEPHIQQP